MSGIYLPVGSICKMKKEKLPVMIIGYKKISDSINYIVCNYPQGITEGFNEKIENPNNIEDIIQVGYVADEHNKYMQNIVENKVSTESKQTEIKTKNREKYEFDENGIVIGVNNNTENKTQNNISNSPYEFDENGIVIAVRNSNNNEKQVQKKQYEFDENGIVVAVSENPFTPNYETRKKEEDLTVFKKYEFDENGIVIGVK